MAKWMEARAWQHSASSDLLIDQLWPHSKVSGKKVTIVFLEEIIYKFNFA